MAVVDKPWDGDAGRFTDEQYQRSCVLDRKSCGSEWTDKPPKTRCSLPIKEPNGDLNKNAVHAAAGRIGSVSNACPAAISAAKSALRSAYKTIGEKPPDSLSDSGSSNGSNGSSKSDDLTEWGVREGVPRHGEVALRMVDEAAWNLRDAGEGPGDGFLGILEGHFAVFDRWTEINNFFEGRFLESIAPGAFTKTFKENGKNMRVLLNHGRDPSIGMKPLGPIRELEEDETGARYEVDLFDTTYNRDLVPGLKHGQFGASFRFQVIREEVNTKPARSAHNPEGIEERKITEAAVREFGPVTFGAYAEATAGLRSLNAEFFDLDIGLRSLDPEGAARFLNHLRTGATEGSASNDTSSQDEGREGRTEDATERRAAPPPRAPERITEPGRSPTQGLGSRRSTLLPGAARSLPPKRQPLRQEVPPWKI